VTDHDAPTAKKQRAEAEHRWPAAVGVLVILVSYAMLPPDLFSVARFGVIALCVALLVPIIVVNPHRLLKETTWSRRIGVALVLVIGITNQVLLVALVQLLVANSEDGPSVLLAALQLWVTNVIGFALLYWELDRGGPVVRTQRIRERLPAADFRFPQDEDHDAAPEVAAHSSKTSNWRPGFVDYLYFSLSDSMAFSPTDVMPLTHRAKLLMGLEAFAGFVLLALVIARGVSLLG
jgi:branched-subunit amino acid transport protein